MTITLRWYSLLFASLLFSCSETDRSVEKKEAREEVLIEDSGFYRGYRLGLSPDSLLSMEVWRPTIANDTIVEFHQELFLMSDTFLVSTYLAFDPYGLFEVQVDLFTQNDSLSKVIIKDWASKLSRPFGEPEELLMAKRWTTFSGTNNLVEITLSQERNDENEEFVSLNYLEPLDDEF